jgi:hypothetical protein
MGARECINKILKQTISQDDLSVVNATRGLIEYRDNNPKEGRNLYKKAVDKFNVSARRVREARALYFWSEEEKRFDSEKYIILRNQVEKLSEKLIDKNDINEIKMLLNKKGNQK